jgi:hypothetical protein
MSRVLLWLIQRGTEGREGSTRSTKGRVGGGGLAEYDPAEPAHARELQGFRERICYLITPQTEVTLKTDQLVLRKPGAPARIHRLKLGNTGCIGPMGLFHPGLFAPLAVDAAQRKPFSDPEEIMDEDFIIDMLQNRPGGGQRCVCVCVCVCAWYLCTRRNPIPTHFFFFFSSLKR